LLPALPPDRITMMPNRMINTDGFRVEDVFDIIHMCWFFFLGDKVKLDGKGPTMMVVDVDENLITVALPDGSERIIDRMCLTPLDYLEE
jgi:hypothetical protein